MRLPNSAIAELSGDSLASPEIDPDRENVEPRRVPVLEPSGEPAMLPLCASPKGFAEIDPDRENGEPFKMPLLEPSGGAAIPPLCPFAKGFAEMVPSMIGKDDT